MSFNDHFSKQATDYSQYRPYYPAALFKYLSALTAQHDTAWDCATGNGQAAVNLATLYNRVEATDASEQQISQATPHAGVHYQTCEASTSPFADNHFDLITVAQALHWFELEKFYPEVKRVSKPNGVFAAWCYGLFKVTTEIDALIQKFHDETVGPYWPAGRKHITNGYSSLAFPFERIPDQIKGQIKAPEFFMSVNWNLPQVLGYLGTWSAVRYYREQHEHDPIEQFAPALQTAWGNPEEAREINWPIYLHVGRVIK